MKYAGVLLWFKHLFPKQPPFPWQTWDGGWPHQWPREEWSGDKCARTTIPGKKMLFSNLTMKLLFGNLIFWQWISDPVKMWIYFPQISSTFSFNCKNAKLLIYATLNMLLGVFPSLNSPTDRGWEMMVMLWATDVSGVRIRPFYLTLWRDPHNMLKWIYNMQQLSSLSVWAVGERPSFSFLRTLHL